jgi:hypothetical protein
VKQTEARANWDDAEVRANVLRQWKMIQARQMAKAEAERLAVEARTSGKSLAELFGNRPGANVVLTEPFSWMTYGAIPAAEARTPPRLSQIFTRVTNPAPGEPSEREAVEIPGNEFMRTVTRLNSGEVAAAMTAGTVACMVRRRGQPGGVPCVLIPQRALTTAMVALMINRQSMRRGRRGSVGRPEMAAIGRVAGIGRESALWDGINVSAEDHRLTGQITLTGQDSRG